MRRILIAVAGVASIVGCGRKDNAQLAADSASRDIQLPRPDSTVALNDAPTTGKTDTVYLNRPSTTPKRNPPATPPAASPVPVPLPAPAPVSPAPATAPVSRTLEAGATMEATSAKALTSRTNKAGETFTATVSEAVLSSTGRVVIPAGSEVTLSIVTLKPAPNKSAKDGTIVLRAVSVTINGESHPIDGDVTYVEHTLKGRGIGTSEAAKVGVGAAAGAIIGKVIGGGTGTAVGAVAGAAGGAAVATETADRDVIVPVGAKIRITIRSAFTA